LESLEARQLLAADLPLVDPLPPELQTGSVHGRKWEDLNRNGQQDGNEPGLAGVQIYADLNWNQRLDRGEPVAVTQRDIPETDFDEAGLYTLLDIPPGQWVIREVVPSGFEQTYPGLQWLPPGGEVPGIPEVPDGGAFAKIEPLAYDVRLLPGESVLLDAAVTIEPVCIRPATIDVMVDHNGVSVENLSGVQINGCGGDVSMFALQVIAHQPVDRFNVIFFDPESGSEYGRIPFFSGTGPVGDGGHLVWVEPGGGADGVNFGNARIAGGSIQGRKWLDRDGNGQQDGNEPGLGGVTIYADLNNNARYDRNEPSAVTSYDDPMTDFDEGGLYQLGGLRPDSYIIREVVPNNYVQTFPGIGADIRNSQTSTMNPGVAIDLELTDVAITISDAATPNNVTAELELTVVWPDSCGTVIHDATSSVVIGDQIIVELSGRQVGEFCAEVISPETVTLKVDGLRPGSYRVLGVLHEFVGQATDDLPTLATVALVQLGGPGFHRVELAENQGVHDINFGNQSRFRPGSVSGTKWLDANGNGAREDDEPGLAGVTIYADLNFNGQWDPDEPSTVTRSDDPATRVDETGQYRLEGLEPGRASIAEIVPAGYSQTFPRLWTPGFEDGSIPPQSVFFVGSPHFVEIPSGGFLRGLDFGNQAIEPASIAGTKWLDANGNGVREDDEPGLAGVTIYADLNFNGQWDPDEPSTVTRTDDPTTRVDESGTYSLADLSAGFYVVREVVPVGYEQTYPHSYDWPIPLPTPLDDRLLDILPMPPFFEGNGGHVVVLGHGEHGKGFDFGNRPAPEAGAVDGLVWIDTDGDGTRDAGEAGLPGAVVYADLNENQRLDLNEPRTITRRDDPDTDFDESGLYVLPGLRPGSQTIRQVIPPGSMQTYPGSDAGILQRESLVVGEGRAMAFELIDARLDTSADGQQGATLTFQVTWPNGCGTLLPEPTEVAPGPGQIDVHLFGTQVGFVCTLAIEFETIDVFVPDVGLGRQRVNAILHESAEPGAPEHPHLLLSAVVGFGRSPLGHRVEVTAGGSVSEVNFGQRRAANGPVDDWRVADMDHDGMLTVADINLLAGALRAGEASPPVHDLSGDGQMDFGDYQYLVLNLMETRFGDSNLDGRFDSADFVQVFQHGQYEDGVAGNSDWQTGDWNGDGEFDSADLVFAFQHGGYEQSSAHAVSPLAIDAVLALLGDQPRRR
jgi:hypothetical protein